MEDPIIGIDLGTTNSCVGIWHEGCIRIIPDEHGYKYTPSCVAFNQSQVLVGFAALSQADFNPINTIFDSKSLLGMRYNDYVVRRYIASSHVKVILGPDNEKPLFSVEYKGERNEFSAEEITSIILVRLREMAEKFIGCPAIKKAVISIPPHFTSAQRMATKEAGVLAGIEVVSLINDPTAAGIAYGVQTGAASLEDRNFLVFDLGAGNCDVSLITIGKGIFQVKSTAGDSDIGGEAFDKRMVDKLVKVIAKKHKKDISGNPVSLTKVKLAYERAKCSSLDHIGSTTIEVFDLCNVGFDISCTIMHRDLDVANMDLYRKCCPELVDKCLTDAKIEKNNVHEVVLVGGCSRICTVQQLLKDFFNGREISTSIDPFEAVAYGAAVQAALIGGVRNGCLGYISLRDVTPTEIGLGRSDGLMDVVIPYHTEIPHVVEKVFTTGYNNQSTVYIKVYESGVIATTGCSNLFAEVELKGIPAAPKGVPRITVRFEVDKDGILSVFVKEAIGHKHKINVINGKAALSIDNMVIDYAYSSFLTWIGTICERGTQRLPWR